MELNSQRKKQFRAIGHHLKPIVFIADNGLTESVKDELERALKDHELIKIKISSPDRESRKEMCQLICQKCKAQQVQSIGNTALLYRASEKADPKLSNVLRAIKG
ncbi:MAG: ribosome assembly RNA-binding protein YhbY [Gammaproteobacteria bacterium]|nr:MAG: ribosome assembly RNA-binding protein YhbY [Gammaproteobacteria bacterium]